MYTHRMTLEGTQGQSSTQNLRKTELTLPMQLKSGHAAPFFLGVLTHSGPRMDGVHWTVTHSLFYFAHPQAVWPPDLHINILIY